MGNPDPTTVQLVGIPKKLLSSGGKSSGSVPPGEKGQAPALEVRGLAIDEASGVTEVLEPEGLTFGVGRVGFEVVVARAEEGGGARLEFAGPFVGDDDLSVKIDQAAKVKEVARNDADVVV